MYEPASQEIREANEAAERRRYEDRRTAALLAAIDSMLFELEELNLVGEEWVPPALAAGVTALSEEIGEGSMITAERPLSVNEVMDVLYEAEEALLRGRRSLSEEEPGAGGQAADLVAVGDSS
jgi:hypothetical protein